MMSRIWRIKDVCSCKMSTTPKRYIDFVALQEYLNSQNIQLVRFPEAGSLTSQADLRRLKSKREKEQSKGGVVGNIPVLTVRPTSMGVSLTDEEVQIALEENIVDFPRIEKYWVDPAYRNQNYCLVSFVPSKNAKPDEDGVFGVMKVRGVFPDEKEATDHARELITNVDSYNTIFIGEVGRALPITIDNEKYASETTSTDIRDKAIAVVDSHMRTKKRDEERETQEQEKRRRELTEEYDPNSTENKLEDYTTRRTGKANLVYNMVNALNQLRSHRASLEKHPEYREQYLSRYVRVCADVGIDESSNPLMAYLKMDGLPFDLDRTLAFRENETELHVHRPPATGELYSAVLPAIEKPARKAPKKAPTPAQAPVPAPAQAPPLTVVEKRGAHETDMPTCVGDLCYVSGGEEDPYATTAAPSGELRLEERVRTEDEEVAHKNDVASRMNSAKDMMAQREAEMRAEEEECARRIAALRAGKKI